MECSLRYKMRTISDTPPTLDSILSQDNVTKITVLVVRLVHHFSHFPGHSSARSNAFATFFRIVPASLDS